MGRQQRKRGIAKIMSKGGRKIAADRLDKINAIVNQNARENLLPCPYCKSDAAYLCEFAPEKFKVCCVHCNADTIKPASREHAVSAWNRSER